MKFIFVTLLLGFCAYKVSSTSIHTGPLISEHLEQKQKDIWLLFKYIHQKSHHKEHVDIAKTYLLESHIADFIKPDVVQHFLKYWKYEMFLPKGEIFSIFHYQHLEQAKALFKLFYYAKDYHTFYKTAVWARYHMNEGLWLYAFSVACIHRQDTYFLVLPPIYEIYPHYFFNSEVINKAHYYKELYYGHANQMDSPGHVIYANYSGHYLNLHPEQSLSYFTEDVDVNAFYYYYHLYYPFWMDGEEFSLKHDKRGEFFYYMHQQILARYYLERLSNGFGDIEWYNWEVPFPTGYYPSLTYPNGLEFPTRPHYAHLYEYFYNYGQKWTFKGPYGYSYTFVQDYERRIKDAIDFGFVYTMDGSKVDLYTEQGLNLLGNMMEHNPESPNYKYYGAYLMFAHHLLGYSYQPLDKHHLWPSAMEHYETMMRDPAFYQFYKRLMMYFLKYKYYLKSYKEQDLYFNGVHVDKVEFDRLVTYFDYYTNDITNAIYMTPEEMYSNAFKVHVKQNRLTHKPFTYKIHVNSDKDTDCIVKVFLGPKYDEYGRYINISENYMNFVQFDHFKYKLKMGTNIITKNSQDIYNYMHDRTSYYEWYQNAMGIDKDKMHFNHGKFWFGFPSRMMLPKGSKSGMPYQFYVFIYPYMSYSGHSTSGGMVGTGPHYIDGYPMGYPFDRPIHYEHMFHQIPNSYFYETKIYHNPDIHHNPHH